MFNNRSMHRGGGRGREGVGGGDLINPLLVDPHLEQRPLVVKLNGNSSAASGVCGSEN